MRSARGFSLVELMIAIVLGLLVTDAMVAMFVSVRSAARTTEGVAGLSDSGRYALDSIEQIVRGAGNLACNSTAPVSAAGVSLVRLENVLNTVGSPLLYNYDQPLSGYEAMGSAPGDTITVSATAGGAADWASTTALGGGLDATLVTPPIPAGQNTPTGTPIVGSDILVVHETLSASVPAYTTQDATGAAQFTISSGTTFAGSGQIAAISNCAQAQLFEVGGFASGTATVSVAGAPAPGNRLGSLDPNGGIFPIGSQIDPVDVIVFYVGIGADGDGALFRYDGNGGVLGGTYATNEELVPDVENMQILYGVETPFSAATQTAAQYVTADEVADSFTTTKDFNGVISVRIALLVASPPGAAPKGAGVIASPPTLLGTNWTLAAPDNRMRKVYEQTMYLRNMSP
ncbi:MAG TPA: PilW family protein [Steroidobacteraceae bacterium]|jgi:type IV pilus assembly protein PilW|nr:PilW family protein [Steroidobacteraceae bacterium]